jgi:hypothetical protein
MVFFLLLFWSSLHHIYISFKITKTTTTQEEKKSAQHPKRRITSEGEEIK